MLVFLFIGGALRGLGRLVRKSAPAALSVGTSLIPGGGIARTAARAVGRFVGRPGVQATAAIGTGAALGARRLIRASRPIPQVPQLPVPAFSGPSVPSLGGGTALQRAQPFDLDTPLDRFGRPVAVQAQMGTRIVCPTGYVSVDLDGDGVKDACVLKPVARAMGLYTPRPKPPITATDARAIRRAKRARNRVAKLAKDVDLHVRKSPPRRKK